MPLIFRAMNPGATTAIWPDVIDYKLGRFADKPATLSLDIAGDTGLGERAVIDCYPAEAKGAANLGDVVFRGYAMPFSTNASGIAKISVPAIEKLLDGRWSMPARYEAGTTIERMLTSDWPTDGKPAGLVCMSNNLVPPGSFRLLSGSVWRLPQGGSVYLGDLSSKHVYINSVQQSFGSSTSLSSGQYWQDSSYLYIYSTTDPATRLVLVEGILDTGIRLGTITGGTATFARSWRVGSGKIQSEIARLLDSAGLEYLYDYNGDGQTYLIAGSAVGRGQNATTMSPESPERDHISYSCFTPLRPGKRCRSKGSLCGTRRRISRSLFHSRFLSILAGDQWTGQIPWSMWATS